MPCGVAGIAIAAGPGHGVCADDGALTASIDNSTTGSGSGTNFVLVGLQCVHKGLVRCRENSEDVQDCLVLLEVPVHADAAPCSLAQGGRYVFFMQVGVPQRKGLCVKCVRVRGRGG